VPEQSLLGSRWDQVRGRFHAEHDRLYGYSLREEATPVEMLGVRLSATGVTAKPALARKPRAKPDPRPALKNRRPLYLPQARRLARVPVFDGDRLTHGHRIAGPAILESVNTSVLVPRGWRAEYDALENCVLTR
jgi:N-methylhydantoinase A